MLPGEKIMMRKERNNFLLLLLYMKSTGPGQPVRPHNLIRIISFNQYSVY